MGKCVEQRKTIYGRVPSDGIMILQRTFLSRMKLIMGSKYFEKAWTARGYINELLNYRKTL